VSSCKPLHIFTSSRKTHCTVGLKSKSSLPAAAAQVTLRLALLRFPNGKFIRLQILV
jgi:hypothetical protein